MRIYTEHTRFTSELRINDRSMAREGFSATNLYKKKLTFSVIQVIIVVTIEHFFLKLHCFQNQQSLSTLKGNVLLILLFHARF